MKPIELEKAVEKVKQVGIRQWLLDELTRAFEDARKGKLKTYDEHHFEQNWIKNIIFHPCAKADMPAVPIICQRCGKVWLTKVLDHINSEYLCNRAGDINSSGKIRIKL